jgi:hypothetical protein
VREREESIRSQILNSDELSKENKNNITTFLNRAKQVLINKQAPVIKHEDPPIIHTKTEEFIPGELNPIEKRITTKTLCVDTLFRENYSKTKSTDYIYKLPVYINNIVSIQLTSFEFPNMINFFSTENNSNTFEIGVYNVNTGEYDIDGNQVLSDASYVITIPDGNYMSDTFQTILNNIFQSTDSIGLKFLKLEVGLQTNTIIRANNPDIDTIGSFPYDLSDNFYSPDFYFKLNFAIDKKLILLRRRNIKYV